MKQTSILSTLVLVLLLGMTACHPDKKEDTLVTIGFEDVELGEKGYLNNRSCTLEGLFFFNDFSSSDWGESWYGTAISKQTDTETEGFLNQYSVSTGAAASGKQFAVLYYSAYNGDSSCYFKFENNKEYTLKSMAITNSTYAYLSMTKGDSYAKKFGEGDWFKMILTSYDAAGHEIATKEVYLADFRNGKSTLLNTWETIDLTSLGKLNFLKITFDSSDKGQWGINTPTYACIDNLVYVVPAE